MARKKRLATPVPKPRARRTKAQIEQLEQQIHAVLALDHPQSVRHVFYRMTDPRLPEPVEKSEAGYKQVKKRLTALRRNGTIPYSWITDSTRRGYHVDMYQNGSEFLRDIKHLYRADLWQHAGVYVEVWCESRSIAGVIEDDCEELAVSLYPSGGYTSLSLAYQAAESINQRTYDGELPAVILFIGDYDSDGLQIGESAEKELRTHLHPDVDLTFDRIAITEEQIAEFELPTKPSKPSARRRHKVEATVEAEAMPAHILRKMLRDSIEMWLPEHALEVAKVAEASEREWIERMARIGQRH